MTNKELKQLLKDLEAGFVSIQNEKNQNAFNVKMLRSQVELKSELIENRNKQIKKMQNIINEKNESIENLEFLLDKKDESIQTRNERISKLLTDIEGLENENININEEIDKMDSFECYMINILDNKNLTDTEKIKLIREKI